MALRKAAAQAATQAAAPAAAQAAAPAAAQAAAEKTTRRWRSGRWRTAGHRRRCLLAPLERRPKREDLPFECGEQRLPVRAAFILSDELVVVRVAPARAIPHELTVAAQRGVRARSGHRAARRRTTARSATAFAAVGVAAAEENDRNRVRDAERLPTAEERAQEADGLFVVELAARGIHRAHLRRHL